MRRKVLPVVAAGSFAVLYIEPAVVLFSSHYKPRMSHFLLILHVNRSVLWS